MATGPVEVLDGLIRGLVLVAYDFARLTVVGIILPFATRTRRVFPGALSIAKRLSSLTYLVIWILAAMSLASGTGTRLALGVLGLEKKSDVQVPTLIAAVLLISMLVDVSVRAGFSLIRNRARLETYEPLARIAVANIFVGMFLLLVWETFSIRGHFRLFGPVTVLFWGGVLRPIAYTNPLLLFFALGLAGVVVKAIGIRNWRRRVYVGLPIVLLVPALLLNASVWLYVIAYTAGDWLFPAEKSRLTQQFTQCSYASGRLHVSSLMGLEGPTALLAIEPSTLAIYGSNFGPYLGRGDDGQAPIMVSTSRFTSVDVDAKYDPLCSLSIRAPMKLLTPLGGPSHEVEYTPDPRTPPNPAPSELPPP